MSYILTFSSSHSANFVGKFIHYFYTFLLKFSCSTNWTGNSAKKNITTFDPPLICWKTWRGEAPLRAFKGYRKHGWRSGLILCDLFWESSEVDHLFWVGMLIWTKLGAGNPIVVTRGGGNTRRLTSEMWHWKQGLVSLKTRILFMININLKSIVKVEMITARVLIDIST